VHPQPGAQRNGGIVRQAQCVSDHDIKVPVGYSGRVSVDLRARQAGAFEDA
jgi:hypothetical protein